MKDRLYFRAVEILIAVVLVAAAVVLMPRTSVVYADAASNGTGCVKLTNKAGYIARIRIYDEDTSIDVAYTDSCAVGQSTTVEFEANPSRDYSLTLQMWVFGWEDVFTYMHKKFDNEHQGYNLIASGTVFNPKNDLEPLEDTVVEPVSATIKASKETVKQGKRTKVKVTSDSRAKLTAVGANKKAKKALDKKYVKIRKGKTAKIIFTKKATAGTYKFKVTSPAKGNYLETTKTITINVE